MIAHSQNSCGLFPLLITNAAVWATWSLTHRRRGWPRTASGTRCTRTAPWSPRRCPSRRSLSSGLSPGSPPSRRGTGCRGRRRSWCRGPRNSSARTCGVVISNYYNQCKLGPPRQRWIAVTKSSDGSGFNSFWKYSTIWGTPRSVLAFGWDYLFSAISHLSRLSRQLGSSSLQALARAWQLGRSSSLPDHRAGVWAHGGWRMDWARKQASSAPFFLKQAMRNVSIENKDISVKSIVNPQIKMLV